MTETLGEKILDVLQQILDVLTDEAVCNAQWREEVRRKTDANFAEQESVRAELRQRDEEFKKTWFPK